MIQFCRTRRLAQWQTTVCYFPSFNQSRRCIARPGISLAEWLSFSDFLWGQLRAMACFEHFFSFFDPSNNLYWPDYFSIFGHERGILFTGTFLSCNVCSWEEVVEALHSPKAEKFSEVDNIPSERPTNGGRATTAVLTATCQMIWETKEWPKEWTQSLVIPLPKKGSPKQC